MSHFVKQCNNPRPHDTVFDPLTGLTWAVKVSSQTALDCAQEYISSLNRSTYCGRNDWRIPTIKELVSLVDYGRHSPAIDTDAFPNTPNWHFASCVLDAENILLLWVVNFTGGHVSRASLGGAFYVRAVCGPVYGGAA